MIQVLVNDLNDPDDAYFRQSYCARNCLNNTLQERAQIGARMNRVELIENRLKIKVSVQNK